MSSIGLHKCTGTETHADTDVDMDALPHKETNIYTTL